MSFCFSLHATTLLPRRIEVTIRSISTIFSNFSLIARVIWRIIDVLISLIIRNYIIVHEYFSTLWTRRKSLFPLIHLLVSKIFAQKQELVRWVIVEIIALDTISDPSKALLIWSTCVNIMYVPFDQCNLIFLSFFVILIWLFYLKST